MHFPYLADFLGRIHDYGNSPKKIAVNRLIECNQCRRNQRLNVFPISNYEYERKMRWVYVCLLPIRCIGRGFRLLGGKADFAAHLNGFDFHKDLAVDPPQS